MKTYLIENHDEALRAWRRENISDADLVHVDAHIDFNPHEARQPEQLLETAHTVEELRTGLERTIAFSRYEKKLSRQTDIGNYIYQAICENRVRDFYWVVPGGAGTLGPDGGTARKTMEQAIKNCGGVIGSAGPDMVKARCMGRTFTICTLISLPQMSAGCLLDIDADFLVVSDIKKADNTAEIGRRKQWISALGLAEILRRRVPSPLVTTVAYSTNGGYTPMKYRPIATEIAAIFSPEKYRALKRKRLAAARYFAEYESTGSRAAYAKAIRLDPAYRSSNNNYGPLHLLAGNKRKARAEFQRILRVDPNNPAALCGLAETVPTLDAQNALALYLCALRGAKGGLWRETRSRATVGAARAFLKLRRFDDADKIMRTCLREEKLNGGVYFMLGLIAEKKDKYRQAARRFADALMLGFGGSGAFLKLAALKRRGLADRCADCLKAHFPRFKRYPSVAKLEEELFRVSAAAEIPAQQHK